MEPFGSIITGLAASFIGGVLIAFAQHKAGPPPVLLVIGGLVGAIGGIILLVGIIGAGVVMGLQDYDRTTGRDPLR